MQLSFVAVALALGATVSAATIEPRRQIQNQECIDESQATVQFTGFPSGEARNICATFVRDCEALKGDPANEKTERSCHRSENDRSIIEAKCVIAFSTGGGSRFSHTNVLGRRQNLRALGNNRFNGNPERIGDTQYFTVPDHKYRPVPPVNWRPSPPINDWRPSPPVDGGNPNDQCLPESREFDRFFVANPNFDDEAATCQRFNDACYRLDGNGSVQITSDCEVSERNIIKSRCIGAVVRGQKSVSFSRRVAKDLGLGLSVDPNGRCNVVQPANKCSQQDFDPKVRQLCRNY